MTNAATIAFNLLRLGIVNQGKNPITVDNVQYIDEDGEYLLAGIRCVKMKPCMNAGAQKGTKEYAVNCRKCKAFWLLQEAEDD